MACMLSDTAHLWERQAGSNELVAQVIQVQRGAGRARRGACLAAAGGCHQVVPQPTQVSLLTCPPQTHTDCVTFCIQA